MRKVLRFFCFGVLPVMALISFRAIGKISERMIYAKQGKRPNMAGAISSMAWSYRGILMALLIIAVSFVLFSKASRTGKMLTLLLVAEFNLLIMYYMEYAVFFPLVLLVVLVVNIIAFIPALAIKTRKNNYD
jgi:hypothetical protein